MSLMPLDFTVKKKSVKVVLPQNLQNSIDAAASQLIEIEKKYYQNDLVPFAQHAAQMKIKVNEFFSDSYSQIELAKKVLKEEFARQEAEHKEIASDSSFQEWEKADQKLKQREASTQPSDSKPIDEPKSLREQLELPWAFMDRAYSVAHALFKEGKYKESKAVYAFLLFLDSLVFEYWFGQAGCEQALKNFEEALQTYFMCLVLQPENPAVFFQIATCYDALKEKESCMKALELCIEHAKNNPSQASFLESATEIKEMLISQKTG